MILLRIIYVLYCHLLPLSSVIQQTKCIISFGIIIVGILVDRWQMVGEDPESNQGLRILARIIARVRLADSRRNAPSLGIRNRVEKSESISGIRRDSFDGKGSHKP